MTVQPTMNTNAASALAARMRIAFKSLRCFLVMKIGGRVPSYDSADVLHQIVLSDVMISKDVFQYDFDARTDESRLESREHIKCPLDYLLEAVNTLRAHHRAYQIKISAILQAMF
jgi:nucleoside phosphorylase